MNKRRKSRQALWLGIRISLVFLMAVAAIILVAYYVLSQNFHSLLSEYSITLVQAMADQGAEIIENELLIEQEEAAVMAASLELPDSPSGRTGFPEGFLREGQYRMVFVSENGCEASDGRARDIGDREDIRAGWEGESLVYGPFYNEEGEFTVCYTVPVKRGMKSSGFSAWKRMATVFVN